MYSFRLIRANRIILIFCQKIGFSIQKYLVFSLPGLKYYADWALRFYYLGFSCKLPFSFLFEAYNGVCYLIGCSNPLSIRTDSPEILAVHRRS